MWSRLTLRARVLAVARQEQPLKQLAAALPGVQILALDATEGGAPAKVFETLAPEVVVVCAGAILHMALLVEQNWEQFSRNWKSDVKLSLLCSQHLDSIWQEWLEGLQIEHESDGTSRLFGPLQDQPALYV